MQFRSSNSKFTHFQGDVLSNIDDSSHGVKLSGGTTGGVVEAIGDETNIALTVRGKGSGNVTLGSSGASVFIAGSTTPFMGHIRFTDTAVATPNFATTNAMVMETTHVITGVPAATAGAATNAFVLAMPHNLSTDCALLHSYIGSTAGDVHCRFAKVSTLTVASATATISFLVTRTGG